MNTKHYEEHYKVLEDLGSMEVSYRSYVIHPTGYDIDISTREEFMKGGFKSSKMVFSVIFRKGTYIASYNVPGSKKYSDHYMYATSRPGDHMFLAFASSLSTIPDQFHYSIIDDRYLELDPHYHINQAIKDI